VFSLFAYCKHYAIIISVIAVKLHAHLNVDFYGRFTPRPLAREEGSRG